MKRRYHHGNLREALVASAERLLEKRGAEALSLREVAKAARVSHGAPYHHFESREALLAAVGERGFDALTAAMRAARGASARERLVGICEAYVSFAVAHPAVFRLMFGPLLAQPRAHAGLRRAAERCFAVLVEAAGELSTSGRMEVALSGWSLAHGLSHLAIDGVLEGVAGRRPAAELGRRLGAWVLRQVR